METVGGRQLEFHRCYHLVVMMVVVVVIVVVIVVVVVVVVGGGGEKRREGEGEGIIKRIAMVIAWG